jgi:hypothetical protein
MSAMNLWRLGILVIGFVGAILYAYGNRHKMTRLAYGVLLCFGAYALAQIALVIYLFANHITFPLNLEAMELTILQHLRRIMDGLPLYSDPSPDFVAFAYTPLYYYLTVPFALIFGKTLVTLRLVAILGMLGSGVIIFLTIFRKMKSTWWGLLAASLFSAAYYVMDSYLDSAHSDSWLVFTILLGCYLIDLNRSRWMNLLGLFSLLASFWFKQPGVWFAIGAVLFLTKREGIKSGWLYWLVAVLVGPVLYLLVPDSVFGPRFHYFTYSVPRQWVEINLDAVRHFGGVVIKSYLPLALLGAAGSWVAFTKQWKQLNIWYFLFPIAVFSGFLGALDPGANNNVFIPMGVWFIITGMMGLIDCLKRFPQVERMGIHLAILGLCFALFLYNPVDVTVSPKAPESYQDLVGYLKSLDGPVYAPWIGQLQDGYEFYPAVHWVPMEDMIRGPGKSTDDHPLTRGLLAPVANPSKKAYILMNYPLENDNMLRFLLNYYVLDKDLGERFAPLSTMPRKYNLLWPRYLYRFAPSGSN